MERCPDDTDLLKVIDDVLPPTDVHLVESHLTSCEKCRVRLDVLSGLAEASAVLRAERPVKSNHLRTAIEQLQGESSNHEAMDLPELEPATRPGFIGRLGKIEIRRLIGRGGMGFVFEGLDPALDRPVAVKLLSPHAVGTRDGRDRLLNEARAAAAVHHEHLVAIHAIEESLGRPFLVLQYVAGESLAERIARQKRLSLDSVIKIGAQAARGLAVAHAGGLIHRDIKPANILLEAGSDAVCIADFGLAKRSDAVAVTQSGFIAGTPAFMSPEQADDRAVDVRTDLFSLGVVLYYASTGILPFAAESPYVLLDQIRRATPQSVRKLNPVLPAWFASIVDRLLEKDPANRISSALELARLLEERSSAGRRRWTGSRRSFVYVAMSLVTITAVTAGAMMFARKEKRSPSISTPSAKEGFVVTGVSGNFATLAEAVRAAPDGGVIEVHGDGPHRSSTIKTDGKRLTIRAALGFRPRFVPPTGETVPLQFIISSADLQLEGIDVNWPARGGPYVSKEDGSLRCVLGVTQGRLTVTHCRIVGGELVGCVWAAGRETVIRHCHLTSPTGAGIAWRPLSDATLRVEQNLLEAQSGILLVWQTPGPVKAGMTVVNNIFAADNALRLTLEASPRLSVDATFSHNAVDCPVVVSLVGFRGFPRSLATHAGMIDVARDILKWTEQANGYRKTATYLSGNRPAQPYVIVPSELRSVNQWLEFWKQPDARSVEGALRPLPAGVGVNAEAIGPGAPYRDWRAENDRR